MGRARSCLTQRQVMLHKSWSGWWYVSTPLKNMSSSVGMMIIPSIWDDYSQLNGKIKVMPDHHQPVILSGCYSLSIQSPLQLDPGSWTTSSWITKYGAFNSLEDNKSNDRNCIQMSIAMQCIMHIRSYKKYGLVYEITLYDIIYVCICYSNPFTVQLPIVAVIQ